MTRFRVLLLEEHGTEHTPTHFALQPPQAIFPACICACVLAVIDLMEDGEVREDGVTGDRGGKAARETRRGRYGGPIVNSRRLVCRSTSSVRSRP